MELEALKSEIEAAIPECRLEITFNPGSSAQHSLRVDPEHGLAAAFYLRDRCQFDFCTNVTGVDWPAKELTEKINVKQLVDGVEEEVEEGRKNAIPGSLGAGYHLQSIDPIIRPP